MNETIYTSSGIVRNASKPRVGIVGANSLVEWIYDEIDNGIDLSWEEFSEELDAKVESGEMTEDEAQEERDHAEMDSRTVLFGSWSKDSSGNYTPDTTGDYAAVYSSNTGNISVEWSKHTKRCNNTSPCYVMADGSGPCGDLDTPGDTVVAYSLPPEMFETEEEQS